MEFAVFYEIQVDSPLKHRQREYEVFHQVLEQVSFAEQMSFTHFWTVEHHFQPGFSHSSAPEVLYGAVSQRRQSMRSAHAVVLLPFPYNHPMRVAERVATLDILRHGRVAVGTGRSATVQELGGFGIPPEETRPRWEEGLRILLRIWTSDDGTFPTAAAISISLSARSCRCPSKSRTCPYGWPRATTPRTASPANSAWVY